MLTAKDIIEVILYIAVFTAEIYFIVWTIKRINNLEKKLNFQKERINQLCRNHNDDLKEINQLKKRIEDLEKQVKNTPE